MADTHTPTASGKDAPAASQDSSQNQNAKASKPADEGPPQNVKVTSPDGRRTRFEGTEEDARAFVQANFPRIHSEPGANYGDDGPPADVVLDTGSGKEFWNGAEFLPVKE